MVARLLDPAPPTGPRARNRTRQLTARAAHAGCCVQRGAVFAPRTVTGECRRLLRALGQPREGLPPVYHGRPLRCRLRPCSHVVRCQHRLGGRKAGEVARPEVAASRPTPSRGDAGGVKSEHAERVRRALLVAASAVPRRRGRRPASALTARACEPPCAGRTRTSLPLALGRESEGVRFGAFAAGPRGRSRWFGQGRMLEGRRSRGSLWRGGCVRRRRGGSAAPAAAPRAHSPPRRRRRRVRGWSSPRHPPAVARRLRPRAVAAPLLTRSRGSGTFAADGSGEPEGREEPRCRSCSP